MYKSKFSPNLIATMVIISFLLFSCATNSQTQVKNRSVLSTSDTNSGNRIKAAEELLNAMNMEKALQKTIERLLEMEFQQQPAIKPYKDVMLKFFNKHMSYNSLKEDLVKIYADAFYEDQLYEITKFYKTPTGQKTIEKMPELTSKAAQIGLKRVQNNQSELEEMIKKESERIQQLQNQ